MSPLAEEYRAFRERGGIANLAGRVKLLFQGADRVRYLNGQVTANVAKARVPSVLPACVATAKGKLCADVFLSLSASAILVDADAALADTLPARMERYIIADDVTMEDATQSVALVHLLGIAPEKLPAALRDALLPSNRYGIPGFDLQDGGALVLAELPVLSDALLELIRIEQGVPRWGFELGENTLPAEAGLDRTHVDFHKGCYIGQEVISRIKSVGHVNRELRGFVSQDGTPLAPGARLFTAAEPEKTHGALTSAAFSFTLDRPIALGYLRRGAPTEGLLAASEAAPDAPVRVTLQPLPFCP